MRPGKKQRISVADKPNVITLYSATLPKPNLRIQTQIKAVKPVGNYFFSNYEKKYSILSEKKKQDCLDVYSVQTG